MKLNVLLATTDQQGITWKSALKNFLIFFKNSQGAFRGEKKTYTPREGTIDDASKKGNVVVQTTVAEKLKWLEENNAEYLDNLFKQERTNSTGIATAELIVDGVNFGALTSLELLRLKSLIESGEFKDMYEALPVRSDSEVWVETTNDDYTNREIYETSLVRGTSRTTVKDPYILEDPNVARLGAAAAATYKPTTASRDTVVELGDYTTQKFSGEATQRFKAEILRRRGKLHTAIIAALKVANDVEHVDSPVTGQKIFDYLHRGQ
jgi:hypothetical protein